MASSMTVLLVEDDARVRCAVRELVSPSRFTLGGEAATVADALRLDLASADVVLLDLGLPDGSGLDVLRALRRERANTLAIVMTVFDDDAHVFEALRLGAVGYLLKDDLVGRLVPAIEEACAGGSPMSPTIARRVLGSFVEPAPSEGVALTKREREVTELLAHGSTYDDVARMLGISTNTVRTFIRSIYEKLHVGSKTEAVREAMRLGIVKKP